MLQCASLVTYIIIINESILKELKKKYCLMKFTGIKLYFFFSIQSICIRIYNLDSDEFIL